MGVIVDIKPKGWEHHIQSDPIVLEPDGRTPEEWAIICKLYGCDPDTVSVIRINDSNFSVFTGDRKKFDNSGVWLQVTERCENGCTLTDGCCANLACQHYYPPKNWGG